MENFGVAPMMTPETQPFWDAASQGKLTVERCNSCGLHLFPPHGVCRRCHGRDIRWVELQPPGVIYSFTVNHNAWSPGADEVYVLAIIEFPDYSGVRFVGFLEGFGTEPIIGALVDFGFRPAFGSLQRLVFSAWSAP
jgi:uncharacterized OB-fold protein